MINGTVGVKPVMSDFEKPCFFFFLSTRNYARPNERASDSSSKQQKQDLAIRKQN